MKKIVGLVITFSFTILTYAQSDAGFGLQFGLHYSNWYGQDIDNIYKNDKIDEFIAVGKGLGSYSNGVKSTEIFLADSGETFQNRLGVHAGIQINSELSDYFWLKHEFLFSTKGFLLNGTIYKSDSVSGFALTKQNTGTMVFRSYQVDVMPISLCGHFYGAQIYIGPYASVSLAQNWVIKEDGGSPLTSTIEYGDMQYYEKDWDDNVAEYDPKREFNILDYGVVAGFEFEFGFGLNFSIFYKQGLASVMETPDGGYKAKAFNKTIGVSTGFTFGKN